MCWSGRFFGWVPLGRRSKATSRRIPLLARSVSIRVTEPVLREVERIVFEEGYTNIGDYVRNLIRKDFKERGIRIKMEEESEKQEGEG